MRRSLTVGLVGCAFCVLPAQRAEAYAVVSAPGNEIAVVSTSAAVVWNPAEKTEHLFLRATFRTGARDFGVLVPTPTRPEIEKATDYAIEGLEEARQPANRVDIERSGITFWPLVLAPFLWRDSERWLPRSYRFDGLRMSGERRVSDSKADVLPADDAGALTEWLRDRGYEERPALSEWLRPYAERKWKIIALKFDGGTADAGNRTRADAGAPWDLLGTDVVRLTFAADRPFFPLREPAQQSSSEVARPLRLFFVGTGRVEAILGESGPPFPGETVWTASIAAYRTALRIPLPARPWLTILRDVSGARARDADLWFRPSTDTRAIETPPFVHVEKEPYWVPFDVALAVGALVRLVVKRRLVAKRRAGSHEAP